MVLVGLRGSLGYAALLGVAAAVMVSYASADDTLQAAPAPPQAEVASASPAEARLAPAAGVTSVPPAKSMAKQAAVKRNALQPAAGDSFEEDEFDGDYTGYDHDPLEPVNRVFFRFNRALDSVLLRPVTRVYRGVVPEKGRLAVTHFLENLYSPVTFANSLLQGDPENSFATLWRFILNTTFGLCGVFDFASEVGLTARTTDMGQTFALYGADSGPYFVIPVMGPSNVRDAFGRLGDAFLFPPNYADEWWVPLSAGAASAIDARSNNMELIDNIYDTSLDPYATFRSAYTQRRAEQIRRARAARDKAQAGAAQ